MVKRLEGIALSFLSTICVAQPAAPPSGKEVRFLREADHAFYSRDWATLSKNIAPKVTLTVDGKVISQDLKGFLAYARGLRDDGVNISSTSSSVSDSIIFSIDQVVISNPNNSSRYGGCCTGSRLARYHLAGDGKADRVDYFYDLHGYIYPNTP